MVSVAEVLVQVEAFAALAGEPDLQRLHRAVREITGMPKCSSISRRPPGVMWSQV